MGYLRSAVCSVVCLAGTLSSCTAGAVNVSISCGAVGVELQLCKSGARAWARKTGNTVRVVSTPNSSTDRLALYQQLLSAGSDSIDVFQIDVIWPSILQNDFIDLKPYVTQSRLDAQFSELVKNDTVNGRLVALPWYIDAGLLYYRKDLLEKYRQPVPDTWKALTETARDIQDKERAAGHRNMWGYVWQGRAYEGLTCDALEWVASYGGGTIVNDAGRITIDNPRAVQALKRAAGWVGTITPTGVLNYAEEQSRGVFQSGHAVFMRNWPYAWPLVNGPRSPVKGKVGVTQLPRGGAHGKHVATLGGWQLAVSKYSKVKKQAVDLVRYLTSEREQKRRALKGGYNPTYRALYQDPDLLKASPVYAKLYHSFVNAIARPSRVTGRQYNRVSSDFWNAVHFTLAGQGSARDNLKSLAGRLDRLSRPGWRR
ncbi:MAG TPA: ABC transporter substrate-binding protein [Gammaproteobacteria bacterium]|nr:ABC transporter substrate-binding protein [Gammaproteobacteria bacterium]